MSILKKSKSVYIGFFVVVTLVATFLLMNFLKGKGFFDGSSTYYTTLKDVNGLTVSSPVHFRGLKIGIVENIEFAICQIDFFVTQHSKMFIHIHGKTADFQFSGGCDSGPAQQRSDP